MDYCSAGPGLHQHCRERAGLLLLTLDFSDLIFSPFALSQPSEDCAATGPPVPASVSLCDDPDPVFDVTSLRNKRQPTYWSNPLQRPWLAELLAFRSRNLHPMSCTSRPCRSRVISPLVSRNTVQVIWSKRSCFPACSRFLASRCHLGPQDQHCCYTRAGFIRMTWPSRFRST